MITINWSCGYDAGYGDIVSPLCYAHNQSEINDDVVTLIMNWRFSEKQSNETSPDANVDYIVKKFNFNGVKIINRYDQKHDKKNLNERLKMIEKLDPMHNVYFPTNVSDPSMFVSCTPLTNNKQFDIYVGGMRSWKQALSNKQWMMIRDTSDADINYRTPIDKAINTLLRCKFFEGYHGSCAWLARLIGVPMKIYSNNPNLTNYCFPWSSDTIPGSQHLLNYYKNARNDYIDKQRRAR